MYEDDDTYESDDDQQADDQPRVDIKALRKAADENPRLKSELKAAQRELAFMKAGIPADDPKMGYFIKGYEGELDPGAIKQAAIEAGFLESQATDPVVVAQAQAQQRVARTASAAPGEFDPAGVLYGLEQAMAQGGVDAMMAFGKQHGLRLARD